MKKPTRPRATRATRPADVPLADSLPANAPSESKSHVVAFELNKNEFGVGILTLETKHRVIRVINCNPPLKANGQAWPWAVEETEYAEDKKTLLRTVRTALFKTKADADAVSGHWRDAKITNAETGAIIQKGKNTQPAANAPKLSSDEQDLRNARLKVLREEYPGTFKAMDTLAQAQPKARPEAVEAVLRAYTVDLMRLHKPAKLGEILPFKTLPDDSSLILELAKAHAAKSPFDAVDHEIAARWFAAGYDKMSLAEYTDAINVKTGAKLKPDAMEKRRYAKLGLMTKKPPGPPPKF